MLSSNLGGRYGDNPNREEINIQFSRNREGSGTPLPFLVHTSNSNLLVQKESLNEDLQVLGLAEVRLGASLSERTISAIDLLFSCR